MIYLFIRWQNSGHTLEVEMSNPGMDNAPSKEELQKAKKVIIGEFFRRYDGKPSDIPGSWSQFRGRDSNNIVNDSDRLADSWPKGGPKVLWNIKMLGEGHAAPAVNKGRVFILDYDEKEKADALRCLSLDDGREIWRRWYKVKAKRNHGISRTIPAVTDKYVVTIGPKCQVMCVGTDSGNFRWGLDLVREFGTEEPFWFTGQCPIIEDDTAIIAPCGKDVLMIGVDCETGHIKWKTPNPDKWNMSHSSIIPVTLHGKKTYIYASLGGIVAVSGEKENAGKVLWKTSKWNFKVIAPSVIPLYDGYFFITAGYGAGGMVFRAKPDNSIEIVKKYKPDQGLCSEQQTPIVFGGYVYGILPKDAGSLRKQLVCYSVRDTQEPVWNSNELFGLGPYIIADNKIYILDDDGTLSMARLNSGKYELLGKTEIMEGHDAWGPFAIVGTRLLLRDLTRMYCLDLGE